MLDGILYNNLNYFDQLRKESEQQQQQQQQTEDEVVLQQEPSQSNHLVNEQVPIQQTYLPNPSQESNYQQLDIDAKNDQANLYEHYNANSYRGYETNPENIIKDIENDQANLYENYNSNSYRGRASYNLITGADDQFGGKIYKEGKSSKKIVGGRNRSTVFDIDHNSNQYHRNPPSRLQKLRVNNGNGVSNSDSMKKENQRLYTFIKHVINNQIYFKKKKKKKKKI